MYISIFVDTVNLLVIVMAEIVRKAICTHLTCTAQKFMVLSSMLGVGPPQIIMVATLNFNALLFDVPMCKAFSDIMKHYCVITMVANRYT